MRNSREAWSAICSFFVTNCSNLEQSWVPSVKARFGMDLFPVSRKERSMGRMFDIVYLCFSAVGFFACTNYICDGSTWQNLRLSCAGQVFLWLSVRAGATSEYRNGSWNCAEIAVWTTTIAAVAVLGRAIIAMLAAVTAAETTGKPGTLSGCTLGAGRGAAPTSCGRRFVIRADGYLKSNSATKLKDALLRFHLCSVQRVGLELGATDCLYNLVLSNIQVCKLK